MIEILISSALSILVSISPTRKDHFKKIKIEQEYYARTIYISATLPIINKTNNHDREFT